MTELDPADTVPVPRELIEALREAYNHRTAYAGNVIQAARALVDAVERPDEPLVGFSGLYRCFDHSGIAPCRNCKPVPAAPVGKPLCTCGHEHAQSVDAPAPVPVSDEAEAHPLDLLIEAVKEPPQVVPTASGGVQLEWHRCGVDIEIDVDAKGDVMGWWAGFRAARLAGKDD